MADILNRTQAHKTIKSLRNEFDAYYAELKAEAKRDGGCVNKADEWERFLEKSREEGILAA